jgi:hypothetical protein
MRFIRSNIGHLNNFYAAACIEIKKRENFSLRGHTTPEDGGNLI